MTEVAYFNAASKLIRAGQMLVSPMCQAVYPHVCTLAYRSRELAVAYLRKTMIVIGGISFVGGLLVIILAKPIVRICMGSKYMAVVPVLDLMAMIPFAFAINNVYGALGMLNFGMKAQFSRMVVISAILNNIILVPLCFWFKASGAAISGLLAEAAVTIVMATVLYGRGIDLLPRVSDVREQMTILSIVANRSFKKLTLSAVD
jgi:PST family polysaccharide transporter